MGQPSAGAEISSPSAVPENQIKSASTCPPVFLPQNVNGLNGPFTFNLWALEGCAIQERIKLTLTYSFALFGINPSTGIVPGPNFSLEKTTATKGTAGYTDLSLTLDRVGEAVPDELLVSLTAQAVYGFPFEKSGTLEWTQFRVDQGEDISSQIAPVLIMQSSLPAKPVLSLPDPVTCTGFQANWLPNQDSEDVLTYTASVSGSTGEIASTIVPATQTSVMLDGLSPGMPYTLGLTATNAAGESQLATLQVTTRYEPTGSQQRILLEQMPHEWDPVGQSDGSLQSAVPSPADMDLDGRVNAVDTIEILHNHNQ